MQLWEACRNKRDPGEEQIVILLDSGHLHPSLGVGVAEQLKDKVVNKKILSIVVANGQNVTSHRKCVEVQENAEL